MKTNIGIPARSAEAVSAILAQLLADETALAFRTRDAHWNITGLQFASLHALFGDQYNTLNEQLDEIAERIRAIGLPVSGQLTELAKASALRSNKTTGKAEKLLQSLLEGHEYIIRSLRKSVEETAKHGDSGTSDFLTGLMESHEKTAWMLRSSLE